MPTKVDQIILAAAIDAMVEDVVKERQKREELLNNLIGKKYIPKDNSFIREIVNGEKKDWHCSLIGVACEIISKPYIVTISQKPCKPFQQRMIKVKSRQTGFIYEVMFCESWIY